MFLTPSLLFADASPVAPIRKQQETKGAMLCCCQVSSVDSCVSDRNEFLPAVCKQQLVKTTWCGGHGRVSHQTSVSDSVLARHVSWESLCFYGTWINNDCAVFSLVWQKCPPVWKHSKRHGVEAWIREYSRSGVGETKPTFPKTRNSWLENIICILFWESINKNYKQKKQDFCSFEGIVWPQDQKSLKAHGKHVAHMPQV